MATAGPLVRAGLDPDLLLLPYLAWVAFAGALNAAVVQLNRPFGPPPAAAGADGLVVEENERWTC